MFSATSEIRVRPATEQDAELVHTMVLEIAAQLHSVEHVKATVNDWRTALARTDVVVFLAFDGDQPVGYVSTMRRFHLWTAADIIALDDLYVRPEARNLGIGRDLMHAVADIAAPEDLTIVWGAQISNDAAHRFYRRLGAEMNTKALFAWSPGSLKNR